MIEGSIVVVEAERPCDGEMYSYIGLTTKPVNRYVASMKGFFRKKKTGTCRKEGLNGYTAIGDAIDRGGKVTSSTDTYESYLKFRQAGERVRRHMMDMGIRVGNERALVKVLPEDKPMTPEMVEFYEKVLCSSELDSDMEED